MKIITFLSVALLSLVSNPAAKAAAISEFQPDPPDIDGTTQLIELSGLAGMSFTGFVLGIGGEASRFGTVDRAASISGTFDGNGLLFTTIPDFNNPTLTIVLVDNFTGAVGVTDIDANNDGIADDLTTLIGIRDAIGVADTSADQFRLYGMDLGGEDFAFTGDEPRLIFRDASIGQWYAINGNDDDSIFDINGNDISGSIVFNGDAFSPSFGAINPTVAAIPEPNSLLAIGSVVAVGVYRRRRRAR